MKNIVAGGILSILSVAGAVSILTPARADGDGLPVGTIIAWGGEASSAPANWLLCNGKALSKTSYKELFTAIGKSWGSSGDKFNLPDLRGRFLRGADTGAGRDPDATKRTPSFPGGNATGVGSIEADSVQDHTHAQGSHTHVAWGYIIAIDTDDSGTGISVPAGSSSMTSTTSATTPPLYGAVRYKTKSPLSAGEETRPENAAVNYIIKAK